MAVGWRASSFETGGGCSRRRSLLNSSEEPEQNFRFATGAHSHLRKTAQAYRFTNAAAVHSEQPARSLPVVHCCRSELTCDEIRAIAR